MEIFNEILEQYMRIGLKNKQYKNNLQSLFVNNKINGTENELDKNLKSQTINILKETTNEPKEYISGIIDVKEVYDKLEFDARRYNRNFDSQTGAVLL